MLVVIVRLVGDEDNGQLRLAEYLCDIAVEVGHSRLDIDKEQYEVGLLGRNLHLVANSLLKDIVGVYHPAAGVNDRKHLAVPFALTVLPVTRSAGNITYDSMTCLRQPVEQC